MGHCFSCFNSSPASAGAVPPLQSVNQKDEMTELDCSNPVTGKAVSDYSQGTRQPLLSSFETHLNGNKKGGFSSFSPFSTQTCANINANSGAPPASGDSVCGLQKPQVTVEKNRSFCQKRLPRSSSNTGESRLSDSRVSALFEVYKDPGEDAILTDGIVRLCNDLELCPDEFKVLVLAWKLNAEQMCCFTKNEFVQGLKSMKVDTIIGIQSRLPEIVAELQIDNELFKDLYRFTFKFGLDVGQRILPSDMAIVLWRLVFTICEPPILNRWLNYLKQHPHVRGIPKDTWNMFLNFCDTVGMDLSSYDDTEAWPSLFDDFVEFENDQMNQNISKSETFKKPD